MVTKETDRVNTLKSFSVSEVPQARENISPSRLSIDIPHTAASTGCSCWPRQQTPHVEIMSFNAIKPRIATESQWTYTRGNQKRHNIRKIQLQNKWTKEWKNEKKTKIKLNKYTNKCNKCEKKPRHHQMLNPFHSISVVQDNKSLLSRLYF